MITADNVAASLGITATGADLEILNTIVSAVNDMVNGWHGYSAADTWRDRHTQGAILAACHLWRRRNSPGGIEGIGENGVAYLQKYDPNAAQLLQLGGWQQPRIG